MFSAPLSLCHAVYDPDHMFPLIWQQACLALLKLFGLSFGPAHEVVDLHTYCTVVPQAPVSHDLRSNLTADFDRRIQLPADMVPGADEKFQECHQPTAARRRRLPTIWG